MGNVAGSSEDEEKAILDHHKQTEDELHQRAAEVGFLRGRVIWFGNFWHDLYYYEVNNHVLLGCFFAHKLNPFDRNERSTFLVCYLLAAFASSYYIATDVDETNTELYYEYLIGSSLALTVYGELMKFFSTCPCMSPDGCCESGCAGCPGCFERVKGALEALGHAGLVLALAFSGSLFAWALIDMGAASVATEAGAIDFLHLLGKTLWTWAQGVLIGWAVNIGCFFLSFLYANHTQSTAYHQGVHHIAYPHEGRPSPEFLTQHDTHNFAAVGACLCPCAAGGATSDEPKPAAPGGDVL